MKLTGEITSIIYQNEVNSYTIAEMYVDEIDGKEDNLITIVGYLPFVVEGDELKVVGRFVEHKEYGRQFKVDTFEKLMPQTLEALERYLGNGMIKGVGPATARKIINTFQEDTINVIKFQPLKLSQIKGITKEKALEISESFIEHWEVWQIVGFLERFGIGAENSKRVYDELGINAIEQIEANPYILIDIARGVDFKQIDQMALELGISYDNDKGYTTTNPNNEILDIKRLNNSRVDCHDNLIDYNVNFTNTDIEMLYNTKIDIVNVLNDIYTDFVDINSIKQIYSLYSYYYSETTLTPKELIDFILNHKDVKISGISASGARETIICYDENGNDFIGLPNIDNRGAKWMDEIHEKAFQNQTRQKSGYLRTW